MKLYHILAMYNSSSGLQPGEYICATALAHNEDAALNLLQRDFQDYSGFKCSGSLFCWSDFVELDPPKTPWPTHWELEAGKVLAWANLYQGLQSLKSFFLALEEAKSSAVCSPPKPRRLENI